MQRMDSSAYESNRRYEQMSDLVNNNSRQQRQMGKKINNSICSNIFCSRPSFFIFGLLSGALILLITLHEIQNSKSFLPPAAKGNNTALGCSSFADIKIFVENSTSILTTQKECRKEAKGNRKAGLVCFQKETGLSQQCISCYDGLTQCMESKCILACLGRASSPGCKQCACSNCRPDFTKCLSVPCTIIPKGKIQCNACPGAPA